MNRLLSLGITASFLLSACEGDPAPVDGGVRDDASLECLPRPNAERPAPGACVPSVDDYAPCEDDAWASCVSDSGEYVRVQESISSIARARAFDAIGALLFDPSRDPSPDDFLEARAIYQEDEGLDSRVVRRYDPHFAAPEGTDCTLDGVPEAQPEYCVGPSTLQPILLDAFSRGAAGEGPARIHAARIEAALLWFFYVSVYKESLTCTSAAKDCDSAYAKYTGGEGARGAIGLGARVREVDPYAHDRVWDGLLALRCWRDLDAAEVATDLALRERARAQLDRALTDGLAALVAASLRAASTTTGETQRYHWEHVRVLAQALDRAFALLDAEGARRLREATEDATPPSTLGELADTIDHAFDCP